MAINNNIKIDKIPYDISISSENEVTHTSEQASTDDMDKMAMNNNIKMDKIPYDISISSENNVDFQQQVSGQVRFL